MEADPTQDDVRNFFERANKAVKESNGIFFYEVPFIEKATNYARDICYILMTVGIGFNIVGMIKPSAKEITRELLILGILFIKSFVNVFSEIYYEHIFMCIVQLAYLFWNLRHFRHMLSGIH